MAGCTRHAAFFERGKLHAPSFPHSCEPLHQMPVLHAAESERACLMPVASKGPNGIMQGMASRQAQRARSGLTAINNATGELAQTGAQDDS